MHTELQYLGLKLAGCEVNILYAGT